MKINIEKYDLDSVLTFGKYTGKTIKDILSTDYRYIEWLVEETGEEKFTDRVLIYLQNQIDYEDPVDILPSFDVDGDNWR